MNGDPLAPSTRSGGGRAAAMRRRRRLVGAAVLVALALGVWMLWHRAATRPAPRRPASPMAAELARLRLGLVSSLGASAGVRSSSSAASTAGVLAVCGMPDGLPVDDAVEVADAASAVESVASDASAASDAPTPVATLPPPTPAEQRILDALAQSPDAYARAAVLVLGPSGDPDDPSARLAHLAQTALHTTDPRVYALAYRACRGEVAPSQLAACADLSTAQWARLDGGNGLPWLYALGDAERQGDTAARDDALFHLAASERIDDHWADMSAAVADRMAPDDDTAALAGWNLAGRAVYSLPPPPYQALIAQCDAAQLVDVNRRQLCTAVADQLIDHSSSLILQSTGALVDRLATGSAERADRLRAEHDALLVDTRMTDYSCVGLRRTVRHLQRAAQIGELAALREARARAQAVPASGS